MSYFNFLMTFLGIPLVILGVLTWLDRRMSRTPPLSKLNMTGALSILFHVILIVPWLCAIALLALDWQRGTYLALIALVLLPVSGYLGLVDSLAIGACTWTIAPDESLPHLILGSLPIEELLFFLVTNFLIVFGMLLIMADDSAAWWMLIKQWLGSARLTRPERQPSGCERS